MKKLNKGFTLVELIIVIAILAIIMLIAIPNFSGIQQRMNVRADKATAAQIGKAVRVWYTDFTSDDNDALALAATGADATFVAATNCADYRKLSKITNYAADTYKPGSLLDGDGKLLDEQYFVVGLTDDDVIAGKICVGIVGDDGDADTNDTPGTLAINATVSYDGTAAAIAYVEP